MGWVKGQSGNPKGMIPTVTAFRTLCQEYSYKAIEMLKEIVENRATHEAVRFQGLKFILEAAHGKAQQSIKFEMDYSNQTPESMTTEQLKMLAQGQTESFLADLYRTGKLKEYMDKAEVGKGQPLLEERKEKEIQDA